MAANIGAAAMGLRVWNRIRDLAEPLAKDGAVVCDSAADACRGADVVLTTLANEAIVAEVMDSAQRIWRRHGGDGVDGVVRSTAPCHRQESVTDF